MFTVKSQFKRVIGDIFNRDLGGRGSLERWLRREIKHYPISISDFGLRPLSDPETAGEAEAKGRISVSALSHAKNRF